MMYKNMSRVVLFAACVGCVGVANAMNQQPGNQQNQQDLQNQLDYTIALAQFYVQHGFLPDMTAPVEMVSSTVITKKKIVENSTHPQTVSRSRRNGGTSMLNLSIGTVKLVEKEVEQVNNVKVYPPNMDNNTGSGSSNLNNSGNNN